MIINVLVKPLSLILIKWHELLNYVLSIDNGMVPFIFPGILTVAITIYSTGDWTTHRSRPITVSCVHMCEFLVSKELDIMPLDTVWSGLFESDCLWLRSSQV